MNDLNSTQQAVIMSFFAPFIDAIVDRVSEKVLEITRIKEPKFYSRKETADLLHVTLPTLSRLTKDGLIESKRVGNRVLYEANSIDEAVKKQVVFKYRRG
ncbi:helix-turn-helix domain-containing protein [uncultured Parabacteroides sp.]|jgi:excisionase family DNA binding protein|uniref:helix-turn-helix domain-containing protein n=1 Tax=uncultured Parabacteroides sp. TaxID=512312 RepID=UPI0025E7C23B|nr:helix-turn-helix domain-containing protein [uncultured Parabacteroides sp.]